MLALRLFFVALLLASALALPASAAPEKRVALVIGNAAYANISPLRKPIDDARKMADILRSLSYEVILATDASQSELESLERRFRAALKQADVGIFYYSGHGFQTNRVEQQHPVNHIVPVDFKLPDSDTALQTLALDKIVSALKSQARVGFILMDACRNDPQLTAASERLASGARTVAISRGFSPVSAAIDRPVAPKQSGGRSGPTGLLIAYATDPGNVALEGDKGLLSPFTTALVKHLPTPGLSAAEVMVRVSVDVSRETQGTQTPWSVSSLSAASYQFVSKPETPAPSAGSREPRRQAPARASPPSPKVPFQLQ